MAKICQQLGVPSAPWGTAESLAAWQDSPLVVDGLFGAGFRGPLRPADGPRFAQLLVHQAAHPRTVVALDLPSGLWEEAPAGSPVLPADLCLALGWGKSICWHPRWRRLCGEIRVLPLGYPRAAAAAAKLLAAVDFLDLVPALPAEAHKGTRGQVCLAGGSPGMPGALVLAAQGASAAGASVLHLFADQELVEPLASAHAEFQVRPLAALASWKGRCKAWVTGPGWGTGANRAATLCEVLDQGVPTVIDADGLQAWKVLAEGVPFPGPVVLTPHPGEWERLAGHADDALVQARELAARWNAVIVLKDSVTWILGPQGQSSVWDGREPSLATAGSGDVLAGIIGAFLARGIEPYAAACAGVIVHGSCGKELAGTEGWFTAPMLVSALTRWETRLRKT
jgi:NAD(P)H-hydrate epimerase